MTRWIRRIARWAIVVGVVRFLRAGRRGSRDHASREDAPTPPGIRMSATNAPSSPPEVPATTSRADPASPRQSAARGRDEPEAGTSVARSSWPTIVKRAWTTAQERQLSLLGAGVAFYAFTSLFPAIIATIMIYGLVADTSTIESHAERLSEAVPDVARQLVLEQVQSLATTSRGSLSFGLVVALLIALWSASGAVGNLMAALNVAYGTQDRRPFVKKRSIALGLTASLIVVGASLLGVVAVFPAVQRAVDLDGATWAVIGRLRWVVLVLLLLVVLTILYRVGPDTATRTSWRSPGAIVATAIWLVASFGFSYYVSNFSNYGATYGSLAAVVVLLLWLWITFYTVLLGASINAQVISERVTGAPTAEDAVVPSAD